MADINVSKTNSLVADAIIENLLKKINTSADDINKMSQYKLLMYLCTTVLVQTKASLSDQKITSDERVKLITDIVVVLIDRLPLGDSSKNVLKTVINDGEIQRLIEELDEKASKKCMACFGAFARACSRSSSSKKSE